MAQKINQQNRIIGVNQYFSASTADLRHFVPCISNCQNRLKMPILAIDELADNAFDIDIFVPGASLVAYVGHQCVK